MIELNPDWVLCISKCGNFKGYFKKAEIHPDFISEEVDYISEKDFKEHFLEVQDYAYAAWERTSSYFSDRSKPRECQFEPVFFSRDEVINLVYYCLFSDMKKVTLHMGEEYVDWSHLSSLASVVENLIANTKEFSVNDALAYWGLPALEELEDNYEVEDLRYTKNTNNETHAHSFKLKF